MPALSTIQGKPTSEPTAKTKAVAVGGGAAAAITTIISYLVFRYGFSEPLDDNLQAALVVLISSAVTGIAGFVASWLTPHGPGEGVSHYPPPPGAER